MTKIIPPNILKGTRDFLPEEMSKRDFAIDKIKNVFKLFGYDQIDTPAIEYAETLMGKYGEEGSKLVYSFEDNGGRKIALRYDQTVPLARVVAANYFDLPMPFKRYQISKVWRADKPAKGRYREFTQCDIDIIGTTNLLSDAEVAKVIYQVFANLGFKKFIIKVNSRRLLNSILCSVGIPADKQSAAIRVLDKLDKAPLVEVEKELSAVISDKPAKELLKDVMPTGNNEKKLEQLAKYDTGEMREFLDLCDKLEIKKEYLVFEPSLARGLDYYTGVIYEVILPEVDIGTVCGGGRYDDLCGLFCEKKFSGVGVAFGLDRIATAMGDLGLLKNISLGAEVLVANFDKTGFTNTARILNQLQASGISAEIYFEPGKLDKQFRYANKKQIPFVVICGPDEIGQGTVTIKNMKTGKQKTIPQSQLSGYFNGYTKYDTN
jgi:histidyl-tRNA synthetase